MGESVESLLGPGGSEELVNVYNEMFKHRYTDEDEEYVKTRDNPLPDPPCVENWYQRPKRNFDFARGGRGGRGGGYNRGYGDRDRHHGQGWHGGRDNRNQDRWGQSRDGGRDRVHYPGRRDDRQHHRYQPYDQGQRHQQGSWQRR